MQATKFDLVSPSMSPTETVGVTTLPGLTVIRKGAWVPDALEARLRRYNPRTQFGEYVKELLFRWRLPLEEANELLGRLASLVVMESQTWVQVIRHPNSAFWHRDYVEDYGVVSRRVITTTGAEMLVDVFQSSASGLTFYWHAIGLSSAAESTANTALTNEMTTLGYGSATRTSGTQTTGATPDIYMTTGTITIDNVSSGTPMVIQEHGIFKSSAVASTGLWDRSLTGTQTLSTGDSISIQYSLTVTAGG